MSSRPAVPRPYTFLNGLGRVRGAGGVGVLLVVGRPDVQRAGVVAAQAFNVQRFQPGDIARARIAAVACGTA